MYVSLHATTHPVAFAGFWQLERDAYACEPLARRVPRMTSQVLEVDLGVPEPVIDPEPELFALGLPA
jgi:hypothetical protein